MTLPNLTYPTAELIAYRDELERKIFELNRYIRQPRTLHEQRNHYRDLCIEVLDILNRRESCPHEDFTENLEGRKCRECGLETK